MKVEKATAHVWSRRFEHWYSRAIHFRKPAANRLDLQWCIEADTFIAEALKEHGRIGEAVALGGFSPTASEINQTIWAIKIIKGIYTDYKEIWQNINANPVLSSRLSKSEAFDGCVVAQFRTALIPGKPANLKVLVYLRDYDKIQALKQQSSPKRKPAPVRTVHPSDNTPIWWAEPEPTPKARSRLEVNREELATLSERVAQQNWRDAFGNRGPQPRSDFRRFRN